MSNRFRIACGTLLVVLVVAMSPSIASADTPGKQCSEPANLPVAEEIDGKWYVKVIDFTVPASWTVWQCIAERFPGRGDDFLQEAVSWLQQKINDDPTQVVRDVDSVPAGYRFRMAADGYGTFPVV